MSHITGMGFSMTPVVISLFVCDRIHNRIAITIFKNRIPYYGEALLKHEYILVYSVPTNRQQLIVPNIIV